MQVDASNNQHQINLKDASFLAIVIVALHKFWSKCMKNFALFTWKHLQATFVILSIHADCWHPTTWSIVILYLDHGLSCIYYWLSHIGIQHGISQPWYLFQPCLKKISASVSIFSSTFVFFKHTCHVNLVTVRKWAGSSS